MIVKGAGSILLLLAAGAFFLFREREERAALSQILSFLSLLKFLRRQIDCFCRPVADVLSADPSLAAACGFTGDLSLLPRERAFDAFLEGCHVRGEAARILSDFAAGLGKSYRDEQVKICDAGIAALETLAEKTRAELPKKQKLRGALCLCGTLSLILLML